MAKAISTLSTQFLRSAVRLHKVQRLPSYAQTYDYTSSSSAMADIIKPRETAITTKLTELFKPAVLQVINESHMHNVPKGSETHFKVVIVSEAFESVPLVQRHRKVNEALGEEFSGGLHALSIVAKTPSQWEKSAQTVGASPPCRGGAGL